MKFTSAQSSKNTKKTAVLFALLGLGIGFTSCKNEVQQPEDVAAVSVINASPDFPSVDFFINDQRFNYVPIEFGGDKVTYFRQMPGSLNGKVRSANDIKVLYSGDFNLVKGKYNSLYILSKGKDISYVVVQDEVIDPSWNKNTARVRFANLSSDAPAYNLELQGDTTNFKNINYKGFTAYRNVTPSKYTVNLKNNITNTQVATLANVEFVAGRYYTVWAKGLVTPATDAQKTAIQVSLHQ